MKYLWENIEDIKDSLNASDKIIILLDFDGTLVAIPPYQKKIHVTQTLKRLLLSIKDNPDLCLGIVSGRTLSNVKSKVGIKDIIFVGSHGWEWEIAGKKECLHLDETQRKALNKLKQAIQKLTQNFTGVSMEEKYCSFSVHYRFADKPKMFQQSLLKLINEETKSGLIKVMKGKKVYDILPNFNWRKGHAVSLIMDTMKKINRKNHLLYIYIGDDTTDEKVFNMHPDILTIRVGKNQSSKAKYYVRNTRGVRKLLEFLKDYHPGTENIA